MYVHRILIEQVINLFQESPSYRDDRFGTIEHITMKHYQSDYGKSIRLDYKLTSDIDRAFRLIQQEVPALRGNTWFDRQREVRRDIAGRIEFATMGSEVKKIAKQLHLFSKTG